MARLAQPYSLIIADPITQHLRLDSFTCTEAFSELTRLEVRLLSMRSDIPASDVLGLQATLEMALPKDRTRKIRGYITRFSYVGALGRHHVYQAVISPRLWFLSRAQDCRIFQNQTVPEIVKDVLSGEKRARENPDKKVQKIEISNSVKLRGTYRKWEYCVQYRETDLNFISRLLEHEGIYYAFDHESPPDVDSVILFNSMDQHTALSGEPYTLPFYSSGGDAPPDTDYITDWQDASEVMPATFTSTDYDFTKPHLGITVTHTRRRPKHQPEEEVYDYPGGFITEEEAGHYASVRLDESDTQRQVIEARTNSQDLRVGRTLSMRRHPRVGPETVFVVTRTVMRGRNGASEGGGGSTETSMRGGFECHFTVQNQQQEFRPARRARKPAIRGPQTAVVVGGEDEEVHTDEYGRIKVQFHWDRLGEKNKYSSCFMRVAQSWAGSNYGAFFIPRVGHEVIVDFLEGDPDQPIVTGCVYNGQNKPPWPMPAATTQSGWQSRSSKKGVMGNANMIRFEDKMGAEKLELHAERDMSTSVERNQSTSVGWDQSNTIGHDQSTTVKNHQLTVVEKGRRVFVNDKGEVYYVKGDKRTVYVDADETNTITKNSDSHVGGNRNENTDGNRHSFTTGEFRHTSKGAYHEYGPLLYSRAGEIKLKAESELFIQAGSVQNFNSGDFRFQAKQNFDFRGQQFNRTIYEGNDTVIGKNANLYVGSSRDVALGAAEEFYAGIKKSFSAGLTNEFFLGLQISNNVGLSLGNTLASIENTHLSVGNTNAELSFTGLSLSCDTITMINSGKPDAENPMKGAELVGGFIARRVGMITGRAGLEIGAKTAIDVYQRAQKDLDDLQNNKMLTDQTRERLKKIADFPFWGLGTENPEDYGKGISEKEISEQITAMEKGAEATPGKDDGVAPIPGVESGIILATPLPPPPPSADDEWPE